MPLPGGVKPPVFQDMAAIFADRGRADGVERRAPNISPFHPAARRSRRRPVVIAIGLTLIGAAAAGSMMVFRAGNAPPVRTVDAMPAMQPSPVAAPVSLPPNIAPVQVHDRIVVAERGAASVRREAKRSRLARAERVPHPVAARHNPRSARLVSAERVGGCEGTVGIDRARCMYPQILETDKALRAAYADAANAGATGRALSPIRNRWARLRRRALVDPDRVADGYRQMAVELRGLHPSEAAVGERRVSESD